MKNFLFLYLKTGGGHIAPARSIANYIKTRYSDRATTSLIDGFTGVNPMIKHIIEDGYKHSQATSIIVYEALYALHKLYIFKHLTAHILSFFIKPHLEKQIVSARADRIVIFHFFLIKPTLKIIRKNGLKTKITVVVTDPFTAHPIWFLHKEVEFIVFSEKIKKFAIDKGIKYSCIHVFPFIIDEKFTKPIPKLLGRAIKENLGLHPDKKLILILGGGDGIPKGDKILKKFLQNTSAAEVVIVCGNNSRLYKKAWALKDKHNFAALKIFGFVDFVYELINIADVVITKCGASTFMEIMISGKIPIINSYIWEQEKGNMQFVRNNRLGIYEKNISRLPERVNEIIFNPHIYSGFITNIENIGLQTGTESITNHLMENSETVRYN